MVQTGGIHYTRRLYLGYGSVLGITDLIGGNGSYRLTGGRLVILDHLHLGRLGTATFDHSGGSATTPSLEIQAQSCRTNAYNLSDSGDVRVSATTWVHSEDGAAASFNQKGGLSFADRFDIGGTGIA
ncbi:MAG: hypothetical protein GY953_56495, partial [bacterium]|nr:hypothetical protein [bacterium]